MIMRDDSTPVSSADLTAEEMGDIRQEHLRRESTIRAIGFLVVLHGIATVVGIATMVAFFYRYELGLYDAAGQGMDFAPTASDGPAHILVVLSLALGLPLAALEIWGGIRLRHLSPAGRILSTVPLGLGVLSMNPVVVPYAIYCLHQLWSEPSPTIFETEYREQIVPATADIRPRTAGILWVTVILAWMAAIALITSLAAGWDPFREFRGDFRDHGGSRIVVTPGPGMPPPGAAPPGALPPGVPGTTGTSATAGIPDA